MTPTPNAWGAANDQWKKQQQPAPASSAAPTATTPQSSPAPGVAPAQPAPATPPQPAQTWGQHSEQHRNYYQGQQPQAAPGMQRQAAPQPQQMPAQTAASYGMPTAPAPAPQQSYLSGGASPAFSTSNLMQMGQAMGKAAPASPSFTDAPTDSWSPGPQQMRPGSAPQESPLPAERPEEELKPRPWSGGDTIDAAPEQQQIRQRRYYGG